MDLNNNEIVRNLTDLARLLNPRNILRAMTLSVLDVVRDEMAPT